MAAHENVQQVLDWSVAEVGIPGIWMPHARYGLGMFEFDEQATGGRTLRGVGGSFWGSYFFAVGTPDGRHTIAVHTNTEWKSWDPMFKIIEAEFGVSIGA